MKVSNEVLKESFEEENTNGAAPKEKKPKVEKVEKLDESTVINAIFKSYSGDDEKSRQLRPACNTVISQYLREKSELHDCAKDYNILLMYDDSRIVRGDADKIYNAVTKYTDKKKPILLILYSLGGSAGSAYLISKLCREYTEDKFVVVIPRIAKSAATLLSCGADEIHMGSLSELGPIDPQIDDLPALGLKHSIEHIADLVNTKPNTAELFAKYLHLSLPLINLGYYERVAESAKHYAMRLLNNNAKNLPKEPSKIAHDLVYSYKDHGFVIDKTEAISIFSDKLIKTNTPEYELGNSLYSELDFIQNVSRAVRQQFYYIGSFDTEPTFNKIGK
jgi:Serine dehydrogenase proteinase